MKNLTSYDEFVNEARRYNLTIKDAQQLHDFLFHVMDRMDDEPTLLRSAYARIQKILQLIRSSRRVDNATVQALQSIFLFVEGLRNKEELEEWRNKLIETDKESYEILLNIIDEYNQVVNIKRDKYSKIDGVQLFNIKRWLFDTEGISPIKESCIYEGILKFDDGEEFDTDGQWRMEERKDGWYVTGHGQLIPVNGEENAKEVLKDKLETVKLEDVLKNDDSREWKVGDIINMGEDEDRIIVENYEEFCDFGCNYIREYLDNNPDINEDEFGEYVATNNKADRDIGELQDVCKEEIERLTKEFNK